MSGQAKPKRILTEEQKAKMKAALEAKRADPAWQEEQKRKREERKANKAAGKAAGKESSAEESE
jgi:Spy/CpxP family protein refolding chaperone